MRKKKKTLADRNSALVYDKLMPHCLPLFTCVYIFPVISEPFPSIIQRLDFRQSSGEEKDLFLGSNQDCLRIESSLSFTKHPLHIHI